MLYYRKIEDNIQKETTNTYYNVLLNVCKQTYGLSIYMLPCAFPFDYLNQQLSSHDNGQFCIYFLQSSFLIHVKGEDSYKWRFILSGITSLQPTFFYGEWYLLFNIRWFKRYFNFPPCFTLRITITFNHDHLLNMVTRIMWAVDIIYTYHQQEESRPTHTFKLYGVFNLYFFA